MKAWLLAASMVFGFCCATSSHATATDDWPMWRYDASRSAASDNVLPKELNVVWSRKLTARVQAWDDPLNLDLMTYDRVFEPIVLSGRMFVGFNDADKLVALDAKTGKELWTFFADAPIRLPPAGSGDRVCFCSDDGHLYCVDAKTGKLNWKFRGAPSSQLAIGNRRIASAWPARGGPVIRDDAVYFAASIWPFMGTFVYALDVESGRALWVNDHTGSQYIKQPHSAPSFAGVAPQGALVATQKTLLVPGGRSVPAAFDRATGEFQYFEINAGGKGTGGSFVCADDQHFYVHTRHKGTRAFRIADGVKTAFMPAEPVLAGELVFSAQSEEEKHYVRAYDRKQKLVWELEVDGTGDLVLAGDSLVAAGADSITQIDLSKNRRKATIARKVAFDRGKIERLIVASGMLFAVTIEGELIAMGSGPTINLLADENQLDASPDEDAQKVVSQLTQLGDAEGYALWYGNWDSALLQALAFQSPFEQLAIVCSDNESVERGRQALDAAGLYGKVTLHHGDASSFQAPPYVANMIFVDASDRHVSNPDSLDTVYESLRPYGGTMVLLSQRNRGGLLKQIKGLDLSRARVAESELGVLVRRTGPLPGAADWTHQYGSIANTVKSDDSRVKLPLGILWFGGSSNMDVLPRHGHGPPEQVVGGRLFIQGMNSLSARDVYTGRVLWKRDFKDLGTFDVYYDSTYEDVPLNPKYNQVHIPGANARGTNFVVTPEHVYIVEGPVCHVLDPATGKTIGNFKIPQDGDGNQANWGYLGVYKNVLIGGSGFAMYRTRNGLNFPSDKDLKKSRAGFGSKSLDRAASASLIGWDRHSGEMLWKVDANHSFWHNGIVAGGGLVYCLDRNPKQVEAALLRRGKPPTEGYRIVAYDSQTGQQAWEVSENIFGTWLGYSEKQNALLQAGAKGSDRLYDEVDQGMAVYEAATGNLRWKNDGVRYLGPCILHNDLIITNANSYGQSAGAFYLSDGKPKLIPNPLTGQMQPWRITRAYGCNNVIASENFLTFRSGAAGFYDLQSKAGTGNLGGFKSGCTSNLIVANGVLNAPDYTRTCSCAYQNQTSLGLVHMPEVEMWTVNSAASLETQGEYFRQLGINFGAAGDRRDKDGLLWIEYPAVAGSSPPVTIHANKEATYFRKHASAASKSETPWIASSGIQGVTDLRIGMKLEGEFTMRSGIPIQHADDDAEESESGAVDRISSDLELVEDIEDQVVGLRFTDINLNAKSKIKSAYIQFTCDETSNEPTSLQVSAEDTGNSERFSGDKHDLSSRSRTTTEVQWNPPPWNKRYEATEIHRTPNLAPLIREIIKREDWKPGNAISFLITGSGKRVAVSSKTGVERSPKLFIDAEPARDDDPSKPKRRYNIELRFGPSPATFDVKMNGKPIGERLHVDANSPREIRQLIEDVAIGDELHLQIETVSGEPVLNGVSIKAR